MNDYQFPKKFIDELALRLAAIPADDHVLARARAAWRLIKLYQRQPRQSCIAVAAALLIDDCEEIVKRLGTSVSRKKLVLA